MNTGLFPAFDAGYRTCRAANLDKAQLRPADLWPHLAKLSDCFELVEAGRSFLGEPIYRVTIGRGPVRILAWSQMHGDESTATASLMDLLYYLALPANEKWCRQWQSRLTLELVVMLNPDGAERGTRVNAQGIDINRDARCLQSPEGRLMDHLSRIIAPHFAFNLHDQNRYYAVGDSLLPATLSLLAPPADPAHTLTPARTNAMRLIGQLAADLQQQLPGHIGRYDDSFSPRAFGDTIAARGAATVLIEAGAHPGDPHRQRARRLICQALVMAIDSIDKGEFYRAETTAYLDIPLNRDQGLTDLLLTNLKLPCPDAESYRVDVSVTFNDDQGPGSINQLGDLAHIGAFCHLDAGDLTIAAGEEYSLDPVNPLHLTRARHLELLRQGIVSFSGPDEGLIIETPWPVVRRQAGIDQGGALRPGAPASWLMSCQGAWRYALLEGILVDLDTGKSLNQRPAI